MSFTENNFIELNVWYAIDKYGKIIELLTAGFGKVPEFVYTSEEKNRILEAYFESKDFNDLIDSSGKELYYFDTCSSEKNGTKYIKFSLPKKPLLISDLSEDIAAILSNNVLDIDVDADDIISIEPIYSTRTSFDYLVSSIVKGKFPLNFKNNYFSIDFKTKLKLGKINSIFRKSSISFKEIRSTFEVTDRIDTSKKYYEISTSQGDFVLYYVYKRNIINFDDSGVYSLQITKKNDAVYDFNDKPGVWIEV